MSETPGSNNKGLYTLEERVKITKKEQELAEAEYLEIHHKVEKLKELLNDYQEKKEQTPNKYNQVIATISLILMILTIGITTYNLATLTIDFMKISSYLTGIISFMSIPLVSYLEVKVIKKIQDIIEKIVQNKMKNSEEYQRIQIQIDCIEEDLENALDEEMIKNAKKVDAIVKYSGASSELRIKNSMIKYYPMNVIANKEEKPYTRQRIKD